MQIQSNWILHPITIFVLSILALMVSLTLYIYWYMKVSSGLLSIVHRFNLDPNQVISYQTWIVILVLSLLVGMILIGILLIFVFSQKTHQLYRLQNNFINNFTHELKTPVTSLKLYIETFIKYDLPRKEQTKYLNFMISDAQRLSDNVSSILNLAKIESKSYKCDYNMTDIHGFIANFLKANDHLFSNAHIRLFPSPKKIPPYPIDQILFEMLLMNILTNGMKYNNAPTINIDITFGEQNRKYFIAFNDNGIGLEKDQLKKIFKKFYQAGTAINRTATGSGIGLYLAQNIAKLHHGKILAQSTGKNNGSTFLLYLPKEYFMKQTENTRN